MGDLFRRHWLPVLTSDEPGILEAFCPHRRALLFWGRNEEHGLRCVYHGWKFDTAGRCVDMPSEPKDSTFKDRVSAKAYPAREYAGFVWIYMGPVDRQPDLPKYEWALVPDEYRQTRKWF